MENVFWIDRWQKNRIGFHQPEINSYLKKHWAAVKPSDDIHVFVPLCGKSLDLVWFGEHGYKVTGCELSEIAVNAFFSENGLDFSVDDAGVYRSESVDIHCGDFFSLNSAQVGQVDVVYDRAALIAMPENMRENYAKQIMQIAPDALILLVTMEYDQQQMDGPPFSVTEQELQRLFGDSYTVGLLEDNDILQTHQRFADRGIDYLHEKIYRLIPK